MAGIVYDVGIPGAKRHGSDTYLYHYGLHFRAPKPGVRLRNILLSYSTEHTSVGSVSAPFHGCETSLGDYAAAECVGQHLSGRTPDLNSLISQLFGVELP